MKCPRCGGSPWREPDGTISCLTCNRPIKEAKKS